MRRSTVLSELSHLISIPCLISLVIVHQHEQNDLKKFLSYFFNQAWDWLLSTCPKYARLNEWSINLEKVHWTTFLQFSFKKCLLVQMVPRSIHMLSVLMLSVFTLSVIILSNAMPLAWQGIFEWKFDKVVKWIFSKLFNQSFNRAYLGQADKSQPNYY